ncbi:hypothetical protein [Segnochrobactrum spirostomi]|uniref:Uncharacterized protein n=1 Tax=Segnochrobactrum spirostomi TaxID=2608987 RepID=A0A6A7Y7X8_9HYPH|nr:hypothetical protein [Segnochrobactrum spirostomi]MQT14956.1 hypothetical protein [Segnochrobactrum spirostomi]
MSRDIFLTGTSEREAPITPLSAGRLSASLLDGGLRWIRWDGVEVIRAITFLVRTPGWGTPAPEISGLAVESTPSRFRVAYAARWRNGAESIAADIVIEGDDQGRLVAAADIRPDTDFLTNRTGFVVLHPLDGFAGTPVTVEHASGPTESVTIPALISPGQPLFDIRAITHTPVDNLSVETRFEGDVFEMEDHRNWSDASFKTYSRPIGLPYPYVLAAGATERQAVRIAITDTRAATGPAVAASADAVVRVAIGDATGPTLPAVLLGLAAEAAAEALPHAVTLAPLGVGGLLVRFDPSKGGGPETVPAVAALAAALGADISAVLLLEAEADPRPEIAAFSQAFAGAGVQPAAVAAFPRADERSFQPGEPRPPAPDEATIAAALRDHFPGVPAGGGTPAFFTELNRKRPPAGTFAFLLHATTPTVHAADDLSVIESLQSLPHILRSARALAGDAPHWIGPIGIGARLNPYGAGPTANPDQIRVGLADADPRQRGLLAAAWHLGYAATIAHHGVAALALAAPTGPFGLIASLQTYPRAWWDENSDALTYPLFHVVADLAEAAGEPSLAAVSTDPSIAALAWRADAGRTLILANLSAEPRRVAIDGLGPARLRVLDAATLPLAARNPTGFRAGFETLPAGEPLLLDAYATARIDTGVSS